MINKVMKNKFVVYSGEYCKIKNFYNETIVKLKPYDYRYLPEKNRVENMSYFDVNFTNDSINILMLKEYFKNIISSNYNNDKIIFFMNNDKIILAKDNLKIIVVFNLFKNIIGDNFVILDDSMFYYGNSYSLKYKVKGGYLYLKNDEFISKLKIIKNNSKLSIIRNITDLSGKEFKNVEYNKTNQETVFFGDKDYYINGFNNILPDKANMKLYTHLPFLVYETPDYTAFFSR